MSESWAKLPGVDLHLELADLYPPATSEAPETPGTADAPRTAEAQGLRGQAGSRGQAGPRGAPGARGAWGRRARLEAALRDAVRTGRLRPGTRLPSSRALAADLGIARNTVAEVYSQLVAEGWLTARTGSGTSVAADRAPDPAARAPDPAARAPDPADRAPDPADRAPDPAARAPDPANRESQSSHISQSPHQSHESYGSHGSGPRYDLRAGVPDLSAFPRRAWLATARKVLAASPDHLLDYPDPRGLPQLRTALAGYLGRARGVAADPANVVICAGFGHGLAATCRALRAAGAGTLAVEAYGHQTHRDIAAAAGLQLRPVPVDGAGAVVGDASGADALLLTPAHQFPLGVALHPRRRQDLAHWGGLVIEDDYDGEFRYDRQPVGALQAFLPDRVIYAGTASKSLAPGLRLGWLVVPPQLLDAVTAELGGGPPALDQLTLAEFLVSGGYDRQVRRARLAYRRRRDRLVAALRRQGRHVGGIAAGLHAVLELPAPDTERDLIARAARHGVAVDGLASYAAAPAPGALAGLVIGYGRPPGHAYTTALARLCAALAPEAP